MRRERRLVWIGSVGLLAVAGTAAWYLLTPWAAPAPPLQTLEVSDVRVRSAAEAGVREVAAAFRVRGFASPWVAASGRWELAFQLLVGLWGPNDVAIPLRRDEAQVWRTWAERDRRNVVEFEVRLRLPATLPSGDYRVRVELADTWGGEARAAEGRVQVDPAAAIDAAPERVVVEWDARPSTQGPALRPEWVPWVLALLGLLSAAVLGRSVAVLRAERRRLAVLGMSMVPPEAAVGRCDWCEGLAGGEALREGERLFCGPACRLAYEAPRQAARPGGVVDAVRIPLVVRAADAPYVHAAIEALKRGMKQVAQDAGLLEGATVRVRRGSVVGGVAPLGSAARDEAGSDAVSGPAATAWVLGPAGGSGLRQTLAEMERDVAWALGRAGLPSPLSFAQQSYLEPVDLLGLVRALEEEPNEFPGRFEQALWATALAIRDLERALARAERRTAS